MSHESESDIDLSLSCGSSSFDEGEIEVEDNHQKTQNYDDACRGINPYQFEPYSHEIDSDANSDNADRFQNTSWCSCGNCRIMPTVRECLCCKDVDKITDIMTEGFTHAQCICVHPGFHPVCLDRYVLQVAYYQYRQQYGERQEQENARARYTAYRQFVRWCWHYLGKEVRVVLPSCVVSTIRDAFPDQSCTGFHSPDSD